MEERKTPSYAQKQSNRRSWMQFSIAELLATTFMVGAYSSQCAPKHQPRYIRLEKGIVDLYTDDPTENFRANEISVTTVPNGSAISLSGLHKWKEGDFGGGILRVADLSDSWFVTAPYFPKNITFKNFAPKQFALELEDKTSGKSISVMMNNLDTSRALQNVRMMRNNQLVFSFAEGVDMEQIKQDALNILEPPGKPDTPLPEMVWVKGKGIEVIFTDGKQSLNVSKFIEKEIRLKELKASPSR